MISIDHLIFVITCLFSGAGSMILFILIVKTLKKRRYDYESVLIRKIEKDLNNYLISATENEGERKKSVVRYQLTELDNSLSKIFDKGILMRHLIKLRKSLSGDFDTALLELYLTLNLHHISLRKLSSNQWILMVRGIHEVSQFNYQPAFGQVTRLLNSKNKHIRQEAQIAKIKMFEDQPLSFLNASHLDLSDWQKLRIHLALKLRGDSTLIDYDHWLDPKQSPEVLIFVTQLSVLFNHVESLSHVRLLIDHNDPQVQIEAINALASFGDNTDAQRIINKLNGEKPEIVVSCLRAMAHLGSQEHCKFILDLVVDGDILTSLEGIKAIHEITGDAKSYCTTEYSNNTDARLTSIIEHVLDPLNV